MVDGRWYPVYLTGVADSGEIKTILVSNWTNLSLFFLSSGMSKFWLGEQYIAYQIIMLIDANQF